jgi:NAD(P)-dependent dehydrogenase (short-subunit alcohol dehydrogenase family)
MGIRPDVLLFVVTLAITSATSGQTVSDSRDAAVDSDRPTVLITGSNRGIGLGFVSHYAAAGWNVIATTRNPSDASALQSLAQTSANISIEELDVLDAAELEGLSQKLSSIGIDLLINNAAFHGGSPGDHLLGTYNYSTFERYMSVNVFGPLAVAEAFVDSIAASKQKKIVTLTTGLASVTSPPPVSCFAFQGISKAAMNKAMRTLQIELRPRHIIVALISPGTVATDGFAAAGNAMAPCLEEMSPAIQAAAAGDAQFSIAESVAAMAKVIEGLDENYDGSNLTLTGEIAPW